MESIFDCKEYTDRRWPPYHDTHARHGRPSDTVVFWFAYTPRGRVSKYWASLQLHYALPDKQSRVRRYVGGECLYERLPSLGGKLKGYRWSKAYLYSGDPKEWEDFDDSVCSVDG